MSIVYRSLFENTSFFSRSDSLLKSKQDFYKNEFMYPNSNDTQINGGAYVFLFTNIFN
jgi:hypothetical protein